MVPVKKKIFIPLSLLITLLAGTGIYFKIIDAYFQSDSFRIIGSIDHLGPVKIWSTFGFFRPLSSLSYFIDYKIWFLNPVGYHLVNIVIHALNAYLVGVLSRLLFRRFAPSVDRTGLLSSCAGLMFLINPSHCKPVIWIPARPDLLVTFFVLSSFIVYIVFRERRKVPLLFGSMALFACGLFSKESAAAFPLVLVAYELLGYFLAEEKPPGVVRPLLVPLVYLCLTLLYPLARYLHEGTFIGGYALKESSFEPEAILPNLITAFFRSFIPPIRSETVFDVLCLGITLCAALAFVIIRISGKKNPPALCLFLVVAFFIAFVPAAGMLGKMPVMKTTDARERFIYLPSVYSNVLVVLVLYTITRNTRIFLACAAVAAMAYAPFLHSRLEYWSAESKGSKTVLEHIKASIHSNPNWREPKEIRKILYESYRKVTGRTKIKPKDFRHIRKDIQLFYMYPPVWLDVDLYLPDGTKYPRR